jgi:hypothetical protein
MYCAEWVRCVPSTFTVDSSICGHNTSITAKKTVNYIIGIEMESTCKLVNDYASMIKEIPMKEIGRIMINNPIYIKASEARIHPNCIVPCGVAFAAWTEADMIAKSLLSHHKSQCIEFLERPP